MSPVYKSVFHGLTSLQPRAGEVTRGGGLGLQFLEQEQRKYNNDFSNIIKPDQDMLL